MFAPAIRRRPRLRDSAPERVRADRHAGGPLASASESLAVALTEPNSLAA